MAALVTCSGAPDLTLYLSMAILTGWQVRREHPLIAALPMQAGFVPCPAEPPALRHCSPPLPIGISTVGSQPLMLPQNQHLANASLAATLLLPSDDAWRAFLAEQVGRR